MTVQSTLRWTWLATCLSIALGAGSAAAQPSAGPEIPHYISPERFVLELRVGPYTPDMGSNGSFETYFGGDRGPLIAAELDVIGWRFHDWMYLGGGGRIGTLSFTGKTLTAGNLPSDEETELSVLPLDLLAVVRVDALARQLSIPLILTGKLGYEWARWSTESGGDSHSGWSVGWVWGVQAALDLDALDRGAARNLDEEWGINHSFIFAELFKFAPTDDSLPIGDSTWTLGLGFIF
jgi:hypothetical protein